MEISRAKYDFLKLTEIVPEGWLKSQLEIQRDGLTGNLDLFWTDVKDSAWFGGSGEGWERGPYWLDGAIPLAVLLKDEILLARIDKYMEYILDNQGEDGWLGPREMNVENVEMIFVQGGSYDLWAQFLALKVLTMYYEIKSTEKVFNSIKKGLESINKHINYSPLFNWGQSRWFEALIPIFWYYEKTGEQWVIDLAVKLRGQGFEWGEFIKYWPYKERTEKKDWNYMSHVVNNTMAVKAYGLWYRISKNEEDIKLSHFIVESLQKYHGTVVGTVTGDECLAGTSHIRGTELCSVVEYMYSLEQLISNTGDLSFGDHLEQITYNALPATISQDFWSHQYDQQVNQIECSEQHEWPWNTNGKDANIFGLEPHFGCCTSNMHQGWPKFTKSLWMSDLDENLICISYAPCKIEKNINGKVVEVIVDSEYPFKNKVKILIDNKENQSFSIFLRIPGWSKSIKIDRVIEKINENLIKVKIKNLREVINIEFQSEIEVINRNNGYFSLKKGCIIYAMPIESQWKRINIDKIGRELPHGDWEVHPTGKWNYSFNENIEKINFKTNSVSEIPFSELNPPCEINLVGNEILNWKSKNGCVENIKNNEIELLVGEYKELKLIPYGCSKLRITEFPIISEKNKTK